MLDEKKYREVLLKYKVDEKTIQDCIVDQHYFMFADSWKIQGYWYEDWCRLLLDLIGVIKGTITFEEEQGFKFWITYTDGEVHVDCVPMTIDKYGMVDRAFKDKYGMVDRAFKDKYGMVDRAFKDV